MIESRPQGKILYINNQTKLHNTDYLVNMFFVFCLMALIIYLIIEYAQNPIKSPSSNADFTLFVIALILAIILLMSYGEKEVPKFSYEINETGFIYPFQMKKIKNDTNFIPYEEIKDIEFRQWGFSCHIKMKIDIEEQISYWKGKEGYLILTKKLIEYLKKSNIPDFELINQYYLAEMNKEPKKEKIIFKNIMEKNAAFK